MVPPLAVSSRQTVAANVSLVIMPTVGFVTLNGSLLDALGEGYLCASPALMLDVKLHGDTWEPNITAANSTLLRTLIDGFAPITPRVVQLGALLELGNTSIGTNYTVQQYRYTGWDGQVQPAMQVERLTDAILRFTIPPVPLYDIRVEEVVELTLIPSLVRSRNPPLVRPLLRVQPAMAHAYGTLLTRHGGNEYAIQNHSTPDRVPLAEPLTLVLVLEGDRWDGAIGAAANNATLGVLSNLGSYQNESSGFLSTVRPALLHQHVTRASDDTVIITLPRVPSYQITQPETLSILIPGVAVASGQDLRVPYNVTIYPTAGAVQLGGPPFDASLEVYMRESVMNRTVVVTLLGDEWDPAIQAGRASRSYLVADDSPQPDLIRKLIDGLHSAQSESGGFDAVLALNRTSIRVRVPSATVLEIDLPVTPAYDIIRPETITLVVPEEAVLTRRRPAVQRDWVIFPSVGQPSVLDAPPPEGAELLGIEELVLQANGSDLFFSIKSDGFVSGVGADTLESVQLIDAVMSHQSEPYGWNSIVRKRLDFRAVERVSEALVVLRVPSQPDYDVLAPETLGVTLPASVLLSGQRTELAQQIVVQAISGSARLAGTLALQGGGSDPQQPCCNREDYLQTGGEVGLPPTLTIMLRDDHFEPGIQHHRSPALAALIAGIRSTGNEPYGWNRIVQPRLAADLVTLSSQIRARDTLSFTLPPLPEYRVDTPEIVIVTLPAISVVSRNVIEATPRLLVRASPGVLVVNGTLVDNPVESTLQYGTSTLEITARRDVWSDAFKEPFTEEGRQAARTLVYGLRSGGVGNGSSWNREVIPALLGESAATNFTAVGVELLSNETVRMYMPRVPAYDVLLPEVIDVYIEPELLKSNSTLTLDGAVSIVSLAPCLPPKSISKLGGLLVSSETRLAHAAVALWIMLCTQRLASLPTALMVVACAPAPHTCSVQVPTPGTAILSGNALTNLTESQLSFNRTVDDLRIEILLRADTWQEVVGVEPAATEAVLRGIRSLQSEGSGWNAIVARGLYAHHARKVSSAQLDVRVPFFPEYEITVPETIVVEIPVGALTSNQSIVATPSIRVQAMSGSAVVTGDLINATVEDRLRTGERVGFVSAHAGPRLILYLHASSPNSLSPPPTPNSQLSITPVCTESDFDQRHMGAGHWRERLHKRSWPRREPHTGHHTCVAMGSGGQWVVQRRAVSDARTASTAHLARRGPDAHLQRPRCPSI